MTDAIYDDQKAVAHANRSFYRAFEASDLGEMRAVWSTSGEIGCVHPGSELLVGPDRIFASWQAIFQATGSIRFEISDVTIRLDGDLAWVANVEHIRSDSSSEESRSVAVATNLFLREDGHWRLLLHHASPLTRRFFSPSV